MAKAKDDATDEPNAPAPPTADDLTNLEKKFRGETASLKQELAALIDEAGAMADNIAVTLQNPQIMRGIAARLHRRAELLRQ